MLQYLKSYIRPNNKFSLKTNLMKAKRIFYITLLILGMYLCVVVCNYLVHSMSHYEIIHSDSERSNFIEAGYVFGFGILMLLGGSMFVVAVYLIATMKEYLSHQTRNLQAPKAV